MTKAKVLILLVTVAFVACVSQAIDTKTVTKINTDMLTLAMNRQDHQRQNRDANAKIDSGNSKKSYHRFDTMGFYKTGHHEKYRYVHDNKGKYNHDSRGFYAPSKIENLISKSSGRASTIEISDAAKSFSRAPPKIRVTLSLLRPISVDEDISFMSKRPERNMKRFNYKRFQTPIVVVDDSFNEEKIEETTTEMMMPSTIEPQMMETTQNMMESDTTIQPLTTVNAIKSHLITTIKQDMISSIKSAEMEEHMMKPSTMMPHMSESHKNEDHMMNFKEPQMMPEMPVVDSHVMDSHIAMSSNDNSQIKKPQIMNMHEDDMMEPDVMESRVAESRVKDSNTKERLMMQTHMTETENE